MRSSYVASGSKAYGPFLLESFGQQKQQRNPATGMDTIGEWIGMYCTKATDGRILLWVGNPRRISCREHI